MLKKEQQDKLIDFTNELLSSMEDYAFRSTSKEFEKGQKLPDNVYRDSWDSTLMEMRDEWNESVKELKEILSGDTSDDSKLSS